MKEMSGPESGSARPRESSTSRPPAAAKPKRGAGKIARSLVSLSASAIVAVYAAGYVQTQAAAQQIATQAAPSAVVVPADSTTTPTSLVPTTSASSGGSISRRARASGAFGSQTTAPTVAPAATTTGATAASAYRDGTYVGTGTSRHGSIQATVVVKAGKIVSAAITQATTRYPVSWIASLPQTVVAQQDTNVNFVSGATDSSSAYVQAVSNALAQAA